MYTGASDVRTDPRSALAHVALVAPVARAALGMEVDQGGLGRTDRRVSHRTDEIGLAQPAVSTIVFGVADVSQVCEALAAPDPRPLEEEALAALRRAWAGDHFRTPNAS